MHPSGYRLIGADARHIFIIEATWSGKQAFVLAPGEAPEYEESQETLVAPDSPPAPMSPLLPEIPEIPAVPCPIEEDAGSDFETPRPAKKRRLSF